MEGFMKVAKRDWIFITVVVVVLGVLFVGKNKLKSRDTPYDDKHAYFHVVMSDRMDIEKKCATCHGPQGIPLSKGHPPKEQCMICHKLSQVKK
jgi:hypothetical protein